jgi:hypothetical protein
MSHKHLGVTLSSDAKWNNHIENIILSVSRHLGIVRKLKYILERVVHPVSEYNLSVFVKIGNPVTIPAASICNFSSLVE